MPIAPRLYLDHAATTPMLPAARAAVAEGMALWANPSSPHAEGRAARAALERARARIKAALGWTGELIFTSGASEAIALAIGGAKVGPVAVSAVEHDAVRRVAGDAEVLPVGSDGRLAGWPESGLVAIQSANSETGVLQDYPRNGEGDHAEGVVEGAGGEVQRLWDAPSTTALRAAVPLPVPGRIWLADCAQTAGKLPLPDADIIVVSAHKLGGPPGIGALLVRDLALLEPSGGQEQGYRAGTENLPGALGFAAALEAQGDWFAGMADLRAKLDAGIEAAGGEIVARDAPRIPTIASYRMPGVSAQAQLIQLDLAGIAVSAGSACSSGTMKPSHVLQAMGWTPEEAGQVIRVSFGWTTTAADVERFLEAWTAIAGRARAA